MKTVWKISLTCGKLKKNLQKPFIVERRDTEPYLLSTNVDNHRKAVKLEGKKMTAKSIINFKYKLIETSDYYYKNFEYNSIMKSVLLLFMICIELLYGTILTIF